MLSISVVLTTYKRPNFLKLAVRSVLNQKFDSYELIIADDASADNTETVVRSFNDSRIVYIKNKENLGFPGNFRNAVEKSRGKYIFLLSDDDFILKKETLSNVYLEMEAKKAGFGRTSILFYENDLKHPSTVATPKVNKTIFIPPGPEIFIITAPWQFGFASGNIYRKDLIKDSDIINDVWFSHVKPIYRIIKKYGAVYFGAEFIVAKISRGINATYLNIDVNSGFHIAKLLKLFREFDHSIENYQIFKKKHLEGFVSTLPAIKLYTSNENIIEMSDQVIKIDHSYQRNLLFWMNLTLAILLPKRALSIIRSVKLYCDSIQIKKYLEKINYNRYAKIFVAG